MTAAKVSRLPAAAPKAKRKPSAAARQAEAEDGYVTVEQCGVQLRIPIGGKVPLKAYMAFVEGDELGGTAELLGPDQWQAFLEGNPTVDDFNEVGDKIRELRGN